VLVAGLKSGFASKALWGPVHTSALSGREEGLGNEGGNGKDPTISARKRREGRGLLVERSNFLLSGAN